MLTWVSSNLGCPAGPPMAVKGPRTFEHGGPPQPLVAPSHPQWQPWASGGHHGLLGTTIAYCGPQQPIGGPPLATKIGGIKFHHLEKFGEYQVIKFQPWFVFVSWWNSCGGHQISGVTRFMGHPVEEMYSSPFGKNITTFWLPESKKTSWRQQVFHIKTIATRKYYEILLIIVTYLL